MATSETNDAAQKLASALLEMESLRPGAEFFADESRSVIVLEVLFNQRVGVDCASAVDLAIHDYFGRPFAKQDERVSEVTAFPYRERILRRSAKRVLNRILVFEGDEERLLGLKVKELPPGIVGAIAALERFLNRENRYFDKLRLVELSSTTVSSLTAADVNTISPIRLPKTTLPMQLASSVAVLEMLEDSAEGSTGELRKRLLELDRIGPETADTLLLYAFARPAVIIDDYLRRVGYRHYAMEKLNESRKQVLERWSAHIKTREQAHRLHARVNELGVDYCLAENPRCKGCPLEHMAHRV